MMTIFQPFANTLWNSLKDTEITKVPKTDLRDTGDSYVLEADMPGTLLMSSRCKYLQKLRSRCK